MKESRSTERQIVSIISETENAEIKRRHTESSLERDALRAVSTRSRQSFGSRAGECAEGTTVFCDLAAL